MPALDKSKYSTEILAARQAHGQSAEHERRVALPPESKVEQFLALHGGRLRNLDFAEDSALLQDHAGVMVRDWQREAAVTKRKAVSNIKNANAYRKKTKK